MKTLLLVILVFASVQPLSASAESYSKAHDDVQALFKGDKEPKVIDALWAANSIFKVGMFDDGTPRNGYAEYVCLTLYEHGFKGKGVWVQVIDYGKLVRNSEWKKIGEAWCR